MAAEKTPHHVRCEIPNCGWTTNVDLPVVDNAPQRALAEKAYDAHYAEEHADGREDQRMTLEAA